MTDQLGDVFRSLALDFPTADRPRASIDWDGLTRKALELRVAGSTYEQIAEELSGDRVRITPWWAYARLNPGKTAAQVQAWRAKHHPAEIDRSVDHA